MCLFRAEAKGNSPGSLSSMAVAEAGCHVPDAATSTWWSFRQPGFPGGCVEQSAPLLCVGSVRKQ